MAITRRHLLQSGAIAAIAPALEKAAGVPAIDQAQAQTGSGEPVWRHALSLFGDVKYPADFQRFDYDFSWVIYRLRKEARWHDGSPVTADDGIF